MGEILDKILQMLENKKPASPQKYFPSETNASDSIREMMARQAAATPQPVSPEAAQGFADGLPKSWR